MCDALKSEFVESVTSLPVECGTRVSVQCKPGYVGIEGPDAVTCIADQLFRGLPENEEKCKGILYLLFTKIATAQK